jgi:hypothetical protein
MHFLRKGYAIATAAIALGLFAPIAVADDITFTFTCQAVGNGTPEPLGDREGHGISMSQTSCHANSGPVSGGVLTGTIVWEWDKTSGILLSGGGIVRKPGSTVAYTLAEGKIALVIADGKVTGAEASGRGTYVLAIGGAASLAGKSFTYTSKSSGPGQSQLDVKVE